MTDKNSFTPDEWKILMESVMATGVAVSAAEPSGLWGMMKEGFASAAVLSETKAKQDANPLVRALVDDFVTSEGRSSVQSGLKEKFQGAKAGGDIKERSIGLLRQASAIVDAKAPQDAPAFKGWLEQLGQRVADASKEGGFLGFGGIQVSEAEKATLNEITNALEASRV
jgi:hypothetical protein